MNKDKKVIDECEDIIRVAKYMPSDEDILKMKSKHNEASYDVLYSATHEGLLLKLFGDLPNYSDPIFEDLWEEVLRKDPEDTFDFCLRKGLDVFDKNGKPVPPWRDIAVILLALDKGILDIVA